MAAVPLDLERRMQHLERKVDELENKMRKDQDRLQKLIMMAMLSGEDLDLSEVLRGLKKADKA
jgi:chaperonin cofactor prefoldin